MILVPPYMSDISGKIFMVFPFFFSEWNGGTILRPEVAAGLAGTGF
jgi:hypothetical protein